MFFFLDWMWKFVFNKSPEKSLYLFYAYFLFFHWYVRRVTTASASLSAKYYFLSTQFFKSFFSFCVCVLCVWKLFYLFKRKWKLNSMSLFFLSFFFAFSSLQFYYYHHLPTKIQSQFVIHKRLRDHVARLYNNFFLSFSVSVCVREKEKYTCVW